jgi:hypothetical protein
MTAIEWKKKASFDTEFFYFDIVSKCHGTIQYFRAHKRRMLIDPFFRNSRSPLRGVGVCTNVGGSVGRMGLSMRVDEHNSPQISIHPPQKSVFLNYSELDGSKVNK